MKGLAHVIVVPTGLIATASLRRPRMLVRALELLFRRFNAILRSTAQLPLQPSCHEYDFGPR